MSRPVDACVADVSERVASVADWIDEWFCAKAALAVCSAVVNSVSAPFAAVCCAVQWPRWNLATL